MLELSQYQILACICLQDIRKCNIPELSSVLPLSHSDCQHFYVIHVFKANGYTCKSTNPLFSSSVFQGGIWIHSEMGVAL